MVMDSLDLAANLLSHSLRGSLSLWSQQELHRITEVVCLELLLGDAYARAGPLDHRAPEWLITEEWDHNRWLAAIQPDGTIYLH